MSDKINNNLISLGPTSPKTKAIFEADAKTRRKQSEKMWQGVSCRFKKKSFLNRLKIALFGTFLITNIAIAQDLNSAKQLELEQQIELVKENIEQLWELEGKEWDKLSELHKQWWALQIK